MPDPALLRRFLRPSLLLASAAWLGCAGEPVEPVVVDGIALMAKGGGGGKVQVNSTEPPGAEQGSVDLAVHVFGSGFDDGSQAEFLLDNRPTQGIVTHRTDFVSESELVATITVQPDADPELYDVEVRTARGRKGIGIELFEVTGKPQECQLGFDLELSDANPVRSDGKGPYVNGTDKVVVFTGAGPGFRFDTNGSQRLEGRKDKRGVEVDFTGTGWEALSDPNVPKGVDFRFDQLSAGLNLCTMLVGETGSVPVNLAFQSSVDGETTGLRYGGTTHAGNDCGALGVAEAAVTRTAQNVWTLATGPTGCLIDAGVILDVVPMPLSFTITAQGAVP